MQLAKFILVKLKNSKNPIFKLFFTLIFYLLKWIRNICLLPQHIYECYISKKLSNYLFFIYRPFIKYAKKNKYRFILNVAPSVGHTTLEIDNFFRQLHLKELDNGNKYIFIVKNNYIFRDFLSLYKKKFYFTKASTFLYNLLLPLFLREKELMIDSGLSRLKWQLYSESDERGVCIQGKPFHFQLFPLEGNVQVRKAFARRIKCPNYFPLEMAISECEPLMKKLGVLGKSLCLVHIKTNVMNATAAPTDPATYLPTLKLMRDLGYILVFVGREKMPDVFSRFGMINYSESRLANFKNDILLFQACSLAIVAGSGIAFLAQNYNKPYLYLNSWHVGLSPFTASSIFVPALVKEKDGKFLTFADQNALYFKLHSMDELFPFKNYDARNADSIEILEAAKELLTLMKEPKPRSALQETYMKIDQGKGVLEFSMSRISQFFIENHQYLLDEHD